MHPLFMLRYVARCPLHAAVVCSLQELRYGELPRELASVVGVAGGNFSALNNVAISKFGVVSHVGNLLVIRSLTGK